MKKRLAVLALAAALMVSSVTVFASSTQERLNEAKQEQYQTAGQLQTTQDRIAVLETKKGETEAYLQELNNQMTELSGEIDQLQQQYADKQKELDEIGVELGNARIEEEKQRKNMKLRIQYMYENSEQNGLLESLFSAASFSDFLNRADNIKNISDYDRDMLEEYNAVCAEIQKAEEKAEAEQAEIAALEEASKKKKAEMQELAEETSAQVAEYAATIEDQEGVAAQLINAIQQQEANIQILTAEVEEEIRQAEAAAEAERQRQAAAAAEAAAAEAAAEEEAAAAEQEEEEYTADVSEEDTSYEEESSASEETAESTEKSSKKSKSTAASTSSSAASDSGYSGTVLNKRAGTITGPSGKETYYNLNMSGVVNIMRNMGNADKYWVRDDGVKMLGDYVMVAANLDTHPRGSIVDSSLGKAIVCDTGTFAYSNPNQLDVAVSW